MQVHGNFFLADILGRNLLADHGLRYAGGGFRYASYASMHGCGGGAGLRAVELGLLGSFAGEIGGSVARSGLMYRCA
jgi:hypothetical protein